MARNNVAENSDPTDFARWTDAGSFDVVWEDRSRFIAALIPPGSSVLDIGCGQMALRRFLPEGCTYFGCDVVARDSRTIVCNLNAGEFPEAAACECDIITMLGVLEYVRDIRSLFERIACVGVEAMFSYLYMPAPGDPQAIERRRKVGWISHLTVEELEAILQATGFSQRPMPQRKPSECLFHVSSR